MIHDRRSPNRSSPSADPRDAAAHWFARVRAGDMDAAERGAFEAWRSADALNEREYELLQRLWDSAGHIPADRLLALAADDPPALPKSWPRTGRWRHAGAALTCLIVLVVVVGAYQWHQAQPFFVRAVDTERGQRETMTLVDGSTVDLNTQTSLQVRYYRHRRIAVLAAGEALFTVKPDAARPFVVEACKGTVRVTGTRFNVRKDGGEVSVSVLSGTVEVLGNLPDARPVLLTAGLGTTIDDGGMVRQPRRVDVMAITSWREGRLVFVDTPLAQVVREVSRYHRRPIRLAGPQVAQLRLSATFNLNDADALLDTLPRILPVRVRVLPDGSAEIYRP